MANKILLSAFLLVLVTLSLAAQEIQPDQVGISVQRYDLAGPVGPHVFLSPDGKTAFFVDTQVVVFDLVSKKVVRAFGAKTVISTASGGMSGGTAGYGTVLEKIPDAALMDNGQLIATVDENSLLFWKTTTGTLEKRITLSRPAALRKLAVSADDGFAVVADEKQRLFLLDLENGGESEIVLSFPIKRGEVLQLAFSRTGHELLISTTAGLYHFEDVRVREKAPEFWSFPNDSTSSSVDFSADGNSFLCSSSKEVMVCQSGSFEYQIIGAAGVIEAQFASGSDKLCLYMGGWYSNGASAIVFYDIPSNVVEKQLPNSFTGYYPSFYLDLENKLLLCSNFKLWNLENDEKQDLEHYTPLSTPLSDRIEGPVLTLSGLSLDLSTLEVRGNGSRPRKPSPRSRTYFLDTILGIGAYEDRDFFGDLGLHFTTPDGEKEYMRLESSHGVRSVTVGSGLLRYAVGYLNGRVVFGRFDGTGRGVISMSSKGPVEEMAFLDERTLILGRVDGTLEFWDILRKRLIKSVKVLPGNIRSIRAASKSGRIFVGDISGHVAVINDQYTVVETFRAHTDSILGLLVIRDERLLFSFSSDKTVKITDLASKRWVCFCTDKSGAKWIIFTDDGYWDGSSDCGSLVAMVRGLEAWNIDQFAARTNRPDIIIERLGFGDRNVILHFHNRYLRRLARLGMTEDDLVNEYRVPRVEILRSDQTGKHITMNLGFTDDTRELKSYQIYVNDVPLFGAVGKRLSDMNRKLTETVELTTGENKIEASCLNSAGAEAFRAVTYATYDEPAQGILYFVGFGVSQYKNRDFDLRYGHKDVLDLAALFGKTPGRTPGSDSRTSDRKGGDLAREAVIKTFINKDVTTSSVRAAKEILEKTTVDDTVVLFISGHGIHDTDTYATYYFLTHEADLDDLSSTAIDFESLEKLLHGIPARKKLFLLDTCGSGELDPQSNRRALLAGGESKGIWARLPRTERGLRKRDDAMDSDAERGSGGDLSGTASAEAHGAAKGWIRIRTYLQDKDRYIYNDLVRRSGAIIFSSCRGDEVSYETVEYENGLFTEYVIKAIEGAGDADRDGIVSTDELQDYVRRVVSEETANQPRVYPIPQHPTVDRDNIYQKFGFEVR